MERWRVGILVFDGVAALDVAGPFDVFSRARLEPGVESRHSEDSALFDVFTVGKTKRPGDRHGRPGAAAALVVRRRPRDRPAAGAGRLRHAAVAPGPETIDWIRRTAATARRTASVCTGALLLARAACWTAGGPRRHWGAFGLLASLGNGLVVDRRRASSTTVCSRRRGSPRGWTSRSTSSRRSSGGPVADETARYLEYRRG